MACEHACSPEGPILALLLQEEGCRCRQMLAPPSCDLASSQDWLTGVGKVASRSPESAEEATSSGEMPAPGQPPGVQALLLNWV